MSTEGDEPLLLPSDGYKELKSFQLAQLVYDITVHFAELYIPRESRTRDQMVQAARSGVQNIAEGSVDAATSTKLDLNLYNVARASLEELKLDYQDYLRQHGEMLWSKDALLYQEFIRRRINSKQGFREFIVWAEQQSVPLPVQLRTIPYKSVLVANGVLLLIGTASYFLKRQIQRKAALFLENGGFAERMYTLRDQKRKNEK